MDMINRDPNEINSHLASAFEDVLAEPDGTQSSECTWRMAATCFNCWKSSCYNFLAFFCGICLAIQWGCQFAYLIFQHVWVITPLLRHTAISCNPCQKLWSIYCNCCVAPICDACGMCLSNIKIRKA